MSQVDPRHSLELLRPEVDALNGRIVALTADQWQAASNCAGWQVADLVAHVVRNGWSLLTFVQRGLAGDPTSPFGQAAAGLQEEIKASGPKAAAERQERETSEMISLVNGLSDADLAKLATHPAGPRPISWGCTQRLVEVAFHHWDLRRSLGADEPLEAGLASYLLGFMLDPAGSSIMLRPVAEGRAPETFRLTSITDGASWRLTASPAGRIVEADPSGPAGVSVEAEAGWLTLALYGRAAVEGPRFKVSGAPDAAQRFAAAFGG